MSGRWEIEIEPEVRDWLELLPFRLYRRVEDKTDRLLDEPTTLGEPYWLASGQRIVLLTVFRKTRMREAAQVERAYQAQKVC